MRTYGELRTLDLSERLMENLAFASEFLLPGHPEPPILFLFTSPPKIIKIQGFISNSQDLLETLTDVINAIIISYSEKAIYKSFCLC